MHHMAFSRKSASLDPNPGPLLARSYITERWETSVRCFPGEKLGSIMVLTVFILMSLILFLRASTILTRNAIRNMERCGGKCAIIYLVVKERKNVSYHIFLWAANGLLQHLLLHYKVVWWEATFVVHNGHNYDQNGPGEGVLLCVHQQTGKEKNHHRGQ